MNSSDIASFDYSLMLADSALIMGQKLSEWNGHGPMLEQDIAMTNIVLDQIGQARLFYQYAAGLQNQHGAAQLVTEDTLAYFRDAHQYKNMLLCELPNGDWGQSVMKIFFYSHWQFYLYSQLIYSPFKGLADIAEKSLKEVAYHNRWSSEWVIRLGDGTRESHDRMQVALEYLWPYTGEMFDPARYEWEVFESPKPGFFEQVSKQWHSKIESVLREATLSLPETDNGYMHTGGKTGVHTEHLGFILAEMQFLQRAYPGLEW